jgi:hypothetical protein
VTRNVKQQLLKLHNFSLDAFVSPPPSIGIELRVMRAADRDGGLVALHGTTQHPAETSRVIGSRHHHDGAEPLMVAPLGKDPSFIFGSSHRSRDLLDGFDSQCPELSNGSGGLVFVGGPSAEELAVHHRVGRVGENCDPPSHPGLNKVSRFEHPGAVGTTRHDDDVGRPQRIIGHERTTRDTQ